MLDHPLKDLQQKAYIKLQEGTSTVNQELAIKPAHLHFILKQISDAVLFIDLEGKIKIFNEAAQAILNSSIEKVLFKKFWDVFRDEEFGFSMKEALKFGISHRLLYQKEREVSTFFVYEGPKSDHGMVLILKDIREKKKLQLMLSRQDQMKELGEMVAVIAHELRNCLGGIRGYASLLYRDLKELVSLQEMAAFILEGTKSLEKIVSGILSYSRPFEIQAETMDLAAFIKQVAKFVKVDPTFPSNVKFSLHIPDAPLFLPFDPEALKSALLNLIFNALQAMPEG